MIDGMIQNWVKSKASFACIALFLFQIFLSAQISMQEATWVELPSTGQKRDPKLFQIVSFGNLMTLVDWLFVKSLADPTLTKAQFIDHSSFYYDLDLLTDLDPAFFDAYFLGGNILPLVQRDGDGAKKLLLKGDRFIKNELPHFPEDMRQNHWQYPWKIYVLMAYNYLFHLDDIASASIAFQQAATFPGIPEYLIRLDRRLKVVGGEYEVGLNLLNFLIQTASTESIKNQLEKKKYNLYIAQYINDVNLSFMGYLKLQPLYVSSSSVSETQMQQYWRDFLKKNQIQKFDPWGGTISLNRNGRVVTSTPHEAVFGLR
jgi:hypothetical protein